ncbi:Eco57I restriction-modification methylase domain-containing protein [Shewanella cyperi]|uniref:Eco57I restriction-modification methylase domain-containing protein n=1 Tax=Shewanella cyperi TaxID=2814292 RepID=UPI001A940F4D|nr:Eco57I restriction-modification methylase domain-containing protein [Shewanella cyperi]QSX40344.1 Eco57I restriction-modification methylase domain-containing protein [Shewanella cyperi]
MTSTAQEIIPSASEQLQQQVDAIREHANTLLDESTRGSKGQFMTPSSVAKLLAGQFDNLSGELSILDAGAGIGSLTTALIARSIAEFSPISVTANTWELEPVLLDYLGQSLALNQTLCEQEQIQFESNVHPEDFISSAVELLQARQRGEQTVIFNKAILNPPYLKIAASGRERNLLRNVGVETGNLYSCFVALALMLLEDGGELVAITPRSFCNGPYFNDFRRVLLDQNALCKLHVFESRTRAFKGDKVLQENIIFHVVKGRSQGDVEITSSTCADDPEPQIRIAPFNEVVSPSNPDRFIHVVTNDFEAQIAKRIGGLPCSLDDLGINTSTGKVVDFRTRENLRQDPDENSVPLIFPVHFDNGSIDWPQKGIKKPNALARNRDTEKQLVPNGHYVLTKRLSAKEENRRIVASMYTPDIADVEMVGFENKTNYFHANGGPLEPYFAKGLCAYLNSTLVDQYFRQFNGHTQVNAADLRVLRYPNTLTLVRLGQAVQSYDQKHIDELIQVLIDDHYAS